MHCNWFPWQQLVRASLLRVERAVGLVVGPFQTHRNPVSPNVKVCVLYLDLDIKLHTIARSRYSQTHMGFATLMALLICFSFHPPQPKVTPNFVTLGCKIICHVWLLLYFQVTIFYRRIVTFSYYCLKKNSRKCWER